LWTDRLSTHARRIIAARKQNKNATTAVDQKVTQPGDFVKGNWPPSDAGIRKQADGDCTGRKNRFGRDKNDVRWTQRNGTIARNHDEIDQLPAWEQRGLLRVSPVQRKAGATKVGTIQIQLKDTNTKKNRYTINVAGGCTTVLKRRIVP